MINRLKFFMWHRIFKKGTIINYLMYKIENRISYSIKGIRVTNSRITKKNIILKQKLS